MPSRDFSLASSRLLKMHLCAICSFFLYIIQSFTPDILPWLAKCGDKCLPLGAQFLLLVKDLPERILLPNQLLAHLLQHIPHFQKYTSRCHPIKYHLKFPVERN